MARKERTLFFLIVCAVWIALAWDPPVLADFKFGPAENLDWPINTDDSDIIPQISPDGLSLFFRRAPKGAPQTHWIASREHREDPWQDPVQIEHVHVYIDIWPGRTTPDGLELYTSTSQGGGQGRIDLWVKKRSHIHDEWGPKINLGPAVNSPADEMWPALSPDGLELYFSGYSNQSVRPGGQGNSDLWVTRRPDRDTPWGTPENLGPAVNSASGEWRPCISADGLLLFFDSTRPGGSGSSDLYMMRRRSISEPWGSPVNLGPAINTPGFDECARISIDGTTLYFDSGYLGQDNFDIWQASLAPVMDLNQDGQIGRPDIAILLDHWRTGDPLCDIAPVPWGDGIVDERDLAVLTDILEPGFGRIAHWQLDETSEATAVDCIGSYHADVRGNALWQPDMGIRGGALRFDGVDDCIAPELVLNPKEGPFRMTAWVQGGAPGQIIASQLPQDGIFPRLPYLFANPADGCLSTQMILPNLILDSEIEITDGQWHEVGFEWDGEYRHLFVDGEEVAADTLQLPGLDLHGWLDIGKGIEQQPGTYWSGLIDEVKIYKQGTPP